MANKKIKQPLLRMDLELGGVSLADKASFAKNLSIMIRSGLSLAEALIVFANSAQQGRLRLIVIDLSKAVSSGSSLSEALGRYPKVFSGFFIGSVYAGEASGTLSENLDKIASELTKERKLKAKIANSLVYPMLILFFAVILVIFTAIFTLPKILPMFQGLRMKLPLSTVWLIAISNFFKDYGIIFATSLFGLIIFLVWFLRLKKLQSFSHGLLISAPAIGSLVKKNNLNNFFRVLGGMLGSGLNIVEALNVCANTVSNFHYKQAILAVKAGVDKGAKLSAMLSRYSSLFPEMAIEMIAVGEESGKLEETLMYLADFYESQIDSATENLATFVEIGLLLLIGLLVGFVAVAIVTPLYSITGHLGR